MTDMLDPRELITNFAHDNGDVQALQFIRDDAEGVEIDPVEDGGGMVNYVYRVKSGDESLIVKYGEETLRMAPEEAMSLKRQTVEYYSLCLMHRIERGSVPEPYCFDMKNNIIAMQDMCDWELLSSQMRRRYIDLSAATHLGQIIGKLHNETSQDNLSVEQWQELIEIFQASELKHYLEGFVFIRPLLSDDPLFEVPDGMLKDYQEFAYVAQTLGLQEKLINLFNSQKCIIHADLHSKSIFMNNGHAAIFDFEMACLGDPAFDLALPIAHYILFLIYNESRSATFIQTSSDLSVDTYKALTINAIRNVVTSYFGMRKELAENETSRSSFLWSLSAYVGFYLCQRSSLIYFHTTTPGLKTDDCRKWLRAGVKLLQGHRNIKTVDEFVIRLAKAH